MSQALEHWLLLFPATFSAFITPFLYYKHILDIPWHTTVAKPLAFNTYNKMSNAIWLHFIPLILYFMFLSLFLVPIHTHTHTSLCMHRSEYSAACQSPVVKLTHGVLIVCRQADRDRKSTHHMDKLVLLSIWQLVELIRADVNERWDMAVVRAANKANTGHAPN